MITFFQTIINTLTKNNDKEEKDFSLKDIFEYLRAYENTCKFNQDSYGAVVVDLNVFIHNIVCPYCGEPCIKWGFYSRFIKSIEGKIEIKIQRLRCKGCGRTHAIHPTWIVPYSQVPLPYQILIIFDYENVNNLMVNVNTIDEKNISYIKRQYDSYWRQRLISEKNQSR